MKESFSQTLFYWTMIIQVTLMCYYIGSIRTELKELEQINKNIEQYIWT